ncbi:hypothetical protein B0H17DRAFT_1147901 [Mycena rosella]|uniref:Uncharacterized protein n=1 Tax=Mycena rosella TaxID=1033263 RepID=A0AAD7G1F4_MYCRO|nr:hypothetical protein B0H17DRAFT_1147901 [Mycena rosella]
MSILAFEHEHTFGAAVFAAFDTLVADARPCQFPGAWSGLLVVTDDRYTFTGRQLWEPDYQIIDTSTASNLERQKRPVGLFNAYSTTGAGGSWTNGVQTTNCDDLF